jgi:hypothetical protein
LSANTAKRRELLIDVSNQFEEVQNGKAKNRLLENSPFAKGDYGFNWIYPATKSFFLLPYRSPYIWCYILCIHIFLSIDGNIFFRMSVWNMARP